MTKRARNALSVAVRSVVQILAGDAERDSRLQRIGGCLRGQGYQVLDVGYEAPPANGLFGAARSVRYARALSTVLKTRPHVIHAHGLDAFRFIVPFALQQKIRIVYDHRPEERPSKIDRLTEHATIGFAARVVTDSPRSAEALTERYGIKQPVVVSATIPKTVIEESTPLRLRLGLPDGARVIAFVGTHTERLTTILRSLPEHVHLAIVGGSPSFSRGDVSGRAHFLPAHSEAELVHQAFGADVGLSFGDHESHDSLVNALLRYAYANVPVCCAAEPAADVLVEQYRLGRRVEGDGTEPWTKVLQAMLILGDPHTLQAASRAEFIGRFCWETQQRALRRLYADLFGDREVAQNGGEP